MGDVWEEMRQAHCVSYTVRVDTSSTLLVTQSNHRVGLLISSEGSNEVFLAWGKPAADNEGVRLSGTTDPLNLSLITHGRMLRGPIFAIAITAPVNVTVVEAMHPCACLE